MSTGLRRRRHIGPQPRSDSGPILQPDINNNVNDSDYYDNNSRGESSAGGNDDNTIGNSVDHFRGFQEDENSNTFANEVGRNDTFTAPSRKKGVGIFQISRSYILLSVVSAFLAIFMSPIEIEYHSRIITSLSGASKKNGIETELRSEKENRAKQYQRQRRLYMWYLELFGKIGDRKEYQSPETHTINIRKDNKPLLSWFEQRVLRLTKYLKTDHQSEGSKIKSNIVGITIKDRSSEAKNENILSKQTPRGIVNEWHFTITKIMDKIFNSTIRLCVIANFINLIFYLLHSIITSWFLSYSYFSNNIEQQQQQQQQQITDWVYASSPVAVDARERVVGFLVFKLLLISAIVELDTLDLLMLVTWFTQLGLLKLIDHISHCENNHMAVIGRPPKTGVVRLLYWVLLCDILAAYTCYKVFHGSGPDMILLLICDCVFLGVETVCHILKYYRCVLEHTHDSNVLELEAHVEISGSGDRQSESQRLYRLQELESRQSIIMSNLDSVIFHLEMTCKLLTVAHFIHIWIIHGLQFTLIDGVIALHLHSAISTALTKLSRQRHVNTVSRNLHGRFPDANEEELRKASLSGDVCCICLGTLSNGGNVKKIACGHLFHTKCLGDVVERENNFETAKCPLCRTPLIDNSGLERNVPLSNHEGIVVEGNNGRSERGTTSPTRQEGEERSLFSFSTVGLWLFPAFSVEVVQRPALGAQVAESRTQLDQTDMIPVDPVISDQQDDRRPEDQQREQVSFVQRLLMLARPILMTPEEEARALGQLVDMFPQYNRHILRIELRERGSIEAVTEAILIGTFPGVPQ